MNRVVIGAISVMGIVTTVAFGDTGNHEHEIRGLIAKMALEEKIGQLSQPSLENQGKEIKAAIAAGRVGSLLIVKRKMCTPGERNALQKIAVEESRLGIPILFSFDAIHGFTTIFPSPLATSASWDLTMAEKIASIAATEARHYGIDLTHSPMVDVSRDPRWGRIYESYGEDVLLNARFGEAVVHGYTKGDLKRPDAIGACVKHFVGYGMSLGGRDYQFTEISRRTLLDTYLPPFEACVKAGAVSVMTAFNDISATPATANRYTLTDVLRSQWSFDGFVLSDWGAVQNLIKHGVAGSRAEAAEKAILAGTDMEMKSTTYWTLPEAIETGRINEEVIDEAVARILRIKFRLGLFDRPYVDEKKALEVQTTSQHRQVARQAAAESMVLLKNDGVLPLRSKLISVTGPFSHNQDFYGWWIGHGDHRDAISAFEGLKANAPDDVEIINGTRGRMKIPVTIVCVGEPGNTFGENRCLTDVTLSKSQVELIKEVKATGSKVIAVIFNGRPLVLTPILEHADAILVAWHPGLEAGNALADVLFGKTNPCGKLTTSFPQATGQIPLFYSDRTSGHPRAEKYLDFDAGPLFPFGFGLSYTDFSYSNLRLSTSSMAKDGSIDVSVDVANSGPVDGKEIVQLYVHDKVASVTRPGMELKDFQKVFIKSGEKRTAHFTLPADALAFYGIDHAKVIEPGAFDLWVGGSSVDTLHKEFRVTK